jgi:hypothetical protein
MTCPKRADLLLMVRAAADEWMGPGVVVGDCGKATTAYCGS